MLCLQTAVEFSRLHMHVKRKCPSLHSTCRRRLWRILTAPSLYISLHLDVARFTNKSVAFARPHPMSHCNAATSAATTRAAAAAMLFVIAVLATAASAVAVVGAGLDVVVAVVVAFASVLLVFVSDSTAFQCFARVLRGIGGIGGIGGASSCKEAQEHNKDEHGDLGHLF